MSSSSATATASRSPSPLTPESSDSLEQVAIHNEFELSSWYHSLRSGKSRSGHGPWDSQYPSPYVDPSKTSDETMLCFSDLIDEHAYDETPSSTFQCSQQPSAEFSTPNTPSPVSPVQHLPAQTVAVADTFIPSHTHVSPTKPMPPPASRPRKSDPPTANQRIIRPPKDSCYNLSIMTPSIPDSGTKSRVETQVRVTVDLVDTNSISPSDPYKYDRIGSWKWLKLPPGTATKKRTRKQGKIDPGPDDTLHLTASVSCASPPHNRVLSCTSCQTREAKRVARKLAARVRPARSDSDSPSDPTSRPAKSKQEDTTSIIQFNCAEVLDFSTGSVVLPLRITCYCRHHREKVGFNVHLVMMDNTGRVVGTGTSRPIMITDDHKSTSSNKHSGVGVGDYNTHGFGNGNLEWDMEWPSQLTAKSTGEAVDKGAPSKRKQANIRELHGNTKKRAKPYDTSARPSREASVMSLTSPLSTPSTLPGTRSPTPPQYFEQLAAIPSNPSYTTPMTESTPSLTSSLPPSIGESFNGTEMLIPGLQSLPKSERTPSPVLPPQTSLAHAITIPSPSVQMPLPFMFFDPVSQPTMHTLPFPTIHRLIPSSGPTHGGIEVTVLGANFHPSLQLNCVFGDVLASSTQRWSDNTLVCVLPPRANAGVVAVWFDGLEKREDDSSPPSLFTYSDESDRALMELALQVVGLKMTGKIEDAKNVAMRIVGSTGESEPPNGGGDASGIMQLSSSITAPTRDIRPLLLLRASTGDSEDFETLIVNFLSILDVPAPSTIPVSSAISHLTPSGQTLLHLAAFLGFENLVRFLISHDVDLDARDRNGLTALHFAALAGEFSSKACARLLVRAGADLDIVNALGRTPEEIAPSGFFRDIYDMEEHLTDEMADDEDEDVRWGDAEEDGEDEVILMQRRRRSLRRLHISPFDVPDEIPSIKALDAPADNEKEAQPCAVDEKQTASFVDMIQRTLTQLHAPRGIINNVSQLPLPHLPLPHLPGMPWGVLPQLPMVFPIFVPMPGWPSFKRGGHIAEDKEAPQYMGAIRSAQDTWEKWMAMANIKQQQAKAPPPMYTPRRRDNDLPAASQEYDADEDVAESSTASVRPPLLSERSSTMIARRFDYGSVPVTDQEVNAFGYRPAKGQSRKLQKKHDRMLILFWIPILLLSLLYAFYSGVQQIFQLLRSVITLKAAIRI